MRTPASPIGNGRLAQAHSVTASAEVRIHFRFAKNQSRFFLPLKECRRLIVRREAMSVAQTLVCDSAAGPQTKVRATLASTFSLVGDGQLMPAFGAARGEDPASVFGAHSRAESVFVGALAAAWLVGAFHRDAEF